jgi:putative sigma-54 modulation protein
MNIEITGRHLDVTPAMRDYVDSKLERILRHSERLTSIRVILSVEKQSHRAEASAHLKGRDIFADAIEEDMYAAIDAMADKLDRQVRRDTKRNNEHPRRTAV